MLISNPTDKGKQLYEAIFKQQEASLFSSLRYMDIEDLQKMEIVFNSEDLILLYDQSGKVAEIHYATNDFEHLITALKNLRLNGVIKFIKKPFDQALVGIGFRVFCEIQDFFNRSLVATANTLSNAVVPEFASKGDCQILSEISRACIGYSRGFFGDDTEWFENWLENGNEIIVHRVQGKIVGLCCVSIYNEGTTLWIRELAVKPKFHRLGVGRHLFEQALIYGAKNGAEKAFLAVDIENAHAIKLYRQYGFVPKEDEYELQMKRNNLK